MLRLFPLLLIALPALAPADAPRQEVGSLQAAVEAHLQRETRGLPGKVSFRVGRIDPRTNVPRCRAPGTYTPPGARPWGHTTVGVRCTDPRWDLRIPAVVNVVVRYAIAARPLAARQPLTEGDLAYAYGDLAQLPAGIVTTPLQAVGRTPRVGIAAGQPLRTDLLRAPHVVHAGQAVRVVSRGRGFEISAEGQALGGAPSGQPVQVRMRSGRVVSGVARPGAVVEMALGG